MSNSIWKTGYPTYRNDNFDEIIVREYKRWAADGVFYLVDDCTELPNRWAYLLDIIAQADKAERLEAENEAMRYEFEVWHGNHQCVLEDNERLQKAVDLAVDALDDIQMTYGVQYDNGAIRFRDAKDIAVRAKKEIKQLIKETQ